MRPRLLQSEDAFSLVETALLTPVLVLMLVGAIDLGRGWYCAIAVSSAAEAGAAYGVQHPGDTTGMVSAAQLDGSDLPSLTATSSTGVECSSSTVADPSLFASNGSCTTNTVNVVEVDTTATYNTLITYPGFPASYTLTGKARMRAAR